MAGNSPSKALRGKASRLRFDCHTLRSEFECWKREKAKGHLKRRPRIECAQHGVNRRQVTKTSFVTLVTFKRSLGLARHSQLRKKKCVSVGQLFDALVERSADAVTCTGA